MEERRKLPRVDVKYRINVICSGEMIRGEPRDYVFHTYTQNLGEGGVRVLLEKKIKPGSWVNLELFITDKDKPVKCDGTVIWSKKANPEGTKPDIFNTGIQFSGLTNLFRRQYLRDVIDCYLGNKP